MDEEARATQPDCRKPDTGAAAVDTAHVLAEEYCWLGLGDERPSGLDDYHVKVRGRQAALCLSGGGIRSAAFALGVMQALSRKRLLTGFHYLSTVSGGGYIGGFIQRWISVSPAGAAGVMDELANKVEPPEIKRLRENSNFITPRVGLGSNDTWTAIAISLRNIVVNWFLFLPLFLLVALLPNWFLSGVDSVPTALLAEPTFDYWLLLLAGTAIAISVACTVPMLPSYRAQYAPGAARGDAWLFWCIVLPVIVWSIAGTLALSADLLRVVPQGTLASPLAPEDWRNGVPLARATVYGMGVGWLVGALFVRGRHRTLVLADFVIWPLSFTVCAAWVWLGAQLFSDYAPRDADFNWASALLTVLGPLWLMTGTLVGAIVFAAFRWAGTGHLKPDDDREWIARVSGLKFKPMLAWALAGFAALLLSELLRQWLGLGDDLSISAIVAAIAGGGAVAGGKSQGSGSIVKSAGSNVMRFIPLQGIVAIATLVFIVALFVLLGGLEVRLAAIVERPFVTYFKDYPWIDPMVMAHLAMAVLLLIVVLVIGRLIPVNRFSLNGLYRNRLARAFLGAARARAADMRRPNPFTGFDSKDNVRFHQLRADDPTKPPEPAPPAEPAQPAPPAKPRMLYPIVNCALNVTATENLAWQERKAEPFIFSPLYSGSGMLDREGTPSGGHFGAYVSSKVYGGSERDLALGGAVEGVTLATAISISGAAASPNMGYHSSPATAFLMTLFNVRLGAWLPNPARAGTLGGKVGRSGPTDSVRAVLRELAGSTTDRGKEVYLSDGGHFENLAVYEMLRRRCRYILVTDAGADPSCAFEDLGGLVRKAKIDFDIDIKFGRLCISPRDGATAPVPQLAWAVGYVRYPDDADGTILYIKPSYFEDALPVDIVSYAKGSGSFPHESTGDQFFSESQFESYRNLGFHFAEKLGPADALGPKRKIGGIADFFEAAEKDYRRLLGSAAAAEAYEKAAPTGAKPGKAGAAAA